MTLPDFSTGLGDRVHLSGWGGNAFGQTWTVDAASPGAFSLHLDLTQTAPYFSTMTFVLDSGELTFTISPWIVPGLSCSTATALGIDR